MFNFNTGKRQSEPTMNTAINGGSGSAPNPSKEAAPKNSQQEAYINSRINEIESQRQEFMKKKPDFDMKSEMENPAFVNYVWKNGLSIEDAYFLTHREEIIEDGIKEAMNRMAIRRSRISENGAGKNSPAVVKKNPKDMTDKEIDSIIDRVRNGEKISF